MLEPPVAALVNPAAGSGRAATRWRRIARDLGRHGVVAETLETTTPDHTAALAEQAVRTGYRTLIAVGGDGTVHQTINGMRAAGGGATDVLFGTVPSGTGMDFARSAGLPRTHHTLVDDLLTRPVRTLDLGQAEFGPTRVFANFAEIGLGSAVAAREDHFSKRWPGRLAYYRAAVDAGLREPLTRGRIVTEEGVVYEGVLASVVVANGRYFGGGLRIAPRASMQDGLLDVIVLTGFSRGDLVAHAWRVYPGLHLKHHKLFWLQTSVLTVETESAGGLDLDGEVYPGATCRFSSLPGELRLTM